jgi:hypothetical protein
VLNTYLSAQKEKQTIIYLFTFCDLKVKHLDTQKQTKIYLFTFCALKVKHLDEQKQKNSKQKISPANIQNKKKKAGLEFWMLYR